MRRWREENLADQAQSKWVAMGEEYKLDGVHPPKKETMERVKGILEQYGHKVMY